VSRVAFGRYFDIEETTGAITDLLAERPWEAAA
jgi:hypothetical protein